MVTTLMWWEGGGAGAGTITVGWWVGAGVGRSAVDRGPQCLCKGSRSSPLPLLSITEGVGQSSKPSPSAHHLGNLHQTPQQPINSFTHSLGPPKS